MDSTLHRPAPAEPLAPPADSLPAGTVIAGRFRLEALAGRGGMGTVYRATDSLSDRRVALKLLHPSSSTNAPRRFTREAELLSALRHPGIVSYVAHGTADNGQHFLAMEWLEGETLAQRLSYEPLRFEETLALMRRAAEALTVAHQQGVIHRDLKPSNLFLRQGRPEDVVLLDFGLARHVLPSTVVTGSQMMLGTPGYMAPEQVSGQTQLTPGADIFSLGCVFYECLTGHPPFAAPHLAAALAKILFTEPVPLRELCPNLPPAFQELLGRMLAKEPARRLPEAFSLREALAELHSHLEAGAGTAVPEGTPLPRLANTEQQLVTVLLAAPRATAGHASGEQDSRLALRDSLLHLLAPQGARVELLADGALVLTLVASLGSATDPASLAARCALSLLERWPEAAVVLTTGRGSLDEHLPVGEAMDRAGHLLRQVDALPPDSAPVLLDEVTAGLLGPGFQLTRAPSGLFQLRSEDLGADESRPLLGKPTPCVGREQELALLELAFTTCVEEPIAQAVLVTAPAGAGKSRLRHEFLRRLERHEPPPLVLLGRGDPMSAGSADGLLGQALRQLCGISSGEPLEERRARLSRRLSQHLPEAQAREVVEFLGELCAIPFPDEDSPRLRAARGDPQLMSVQVGRALVAFLKAECARHPVLLVLEDLHWGDPLSVRLMDEALRGLTEQPFLVLALARPEVEPLLAGWRARRPQAMPLKGLSRKAGARLVREMLGAQVTDSLVDRLVEQAAGNALFLEELIRAVAEGRGEAPPETVLAMLQARLGRLESEARQVLLAASFFGRTFWAGGVRALLSGQLSDEALEQQLSTLVEGEWVEPRPASRFPGEDEYRFRHALVRDAAYGLVPDSQKSAGHRLAGPWLEQRGESDPGVLAQHHHLGQQLERAAHYYSDSAERLVVRCDFPGALRCVESALTCAPSDQGRIRLRALQALILGWMKDLSKMFDMGLSVLPELKAGDALWCRLMGNLLGGGGLTGRHEEVVKLGQLLVRTTPEAGATAAWLEALSLLCCAASWSGARPQALALLQRMEQVGAEVMTREPSARGWVNLARAFFHHLLDDTPWRALQWAEQGTSAFLEVGAEINSITTRGIIGRSLAAMGDVSGAEEQLRQCLTIARRMEQNLTLSIARSELAVILAGGSEPRQWEEARALAMEEMATPGARMHRGLVHGVLAQLAARRGEWAEAEARAHETSELLAPFPAMRLAFVARTVGPLLLAQGRTAEARDMALRGVQEWEALGGAGLPAVGVRLALAEACLAEGDTQAAEAPLRRALQSLRTQAEDLPDAAARERFFHQVPENARTLELARQRWGTAEVP